MCVRGEIATGEESVGALKELIIDPMEKTRERGGAGKKKRIPTNSIGRIGRTG